MSRIDLTCVPLALLDANSDSLFSARLIPARTEVIASVTAPPPAVYAHSFWPLEMWETWLKHVTRPLDKAPGYVRVTMAGLPAAAGKSLNG